MAHDPHFPLAEIFETKTYPHARTLRTSFAQKLWDTYNALAGKPPIIMRKPYVGIFDYLTLYIPAGLLFLMGWCLKNKGKNFLATVLLWPVVLINIPLLIARVTFSFVTTVLFSPIIALVHGISRLAAGRSHKEAFSLVGETQQGNEQSLGEYLTAHNLDVEELNITIGKSQKQETENSSGSYQLMFFRKSIGPSDAIACEGCINGSCDATHAPFAVKIRQEEGITAGKQATNIHALFKLNVGDAVSNIENADISDSDKQTILAI